MNKIVLGMTAMIAAIAAIAPIGAAQACGDEPLASYTASFGSDHYNSNGQQLSTVAQILQQDRANVNSRGIRDAGDMPDDYFTTPQARAQFATWLQDGYLDEAARDAILNGSGQVTVYVYDGYVEVVPA